MSVKRDGIGIRTENLSRQLSTKSSKRSVTEGAEEKATDIAESIMSDILEKALEIIYVTYMENQTIKFVVHCAHQAFMKLIRIHFYQHNNYMRTPALWNAEKRTPISSPDSWAINQVPVQRNLPPKEELNSLSRIKLEMADKAIESSSVTDLISEPSETLIRDLRSILDDLIDKLPIQDQTEMAEQIETVSVDGVFPLIVDGQHHYNQHEIAKVSLEQCPVFKLPKITLPDSVRSRSQSQTEQLLGEGEKLPPIRTGANLKCRQNQSQPEMGKKKK